MLSIFASRSWPDRFLTYYEALEEEAAAGHAELGPETNRYFREYSGGFSVYQKYRFARSRVITFRGLATRGIQQAIEGIRDRPCQILDAGCGIGTESIFFALLGGSVHGVDLRDSRLLVGRGRKAYFEGRFATSLDLTFEHTSVFEIPRRDHYDAIFVQEAISHIDPVDRFLQAASSMLRRKGRIVIHDPNGMNPYKQLQAWREHRGERHVTITDPHSGFQFHQANERFISPLRLRKMLIDCGFEIRCLLTSGYFPIFWHNGITTPILGAAERLFQRMPVLSMLGGYYLVEAEKN